MAQALLPVRRCCGAILAILGESGPIALLDDWFQALEKFNPLDISASGHKVLSSPVSTARIHLPKWKQSFADENRSIHSVLCRPALARSWPRHGARPATPSLRRRFPARPDLLRPARLQQRILE